MTEDHGRGFRGHPLITLISLVASVIGIAVFITGKQKLSDFVSDMRVSRPGMQPKQPAPKGNTLSRSAGNAARNERSVGSRKPSPREIVVVLNPSNADDIWTTSVYSYGPHGGGPGGGLNDQGLRVGGWGDLYYALIRFSLEGLPKTVMAATLKLYSLPNQHNEGPCPLFLDRILGPWDWRANGTGVDRERLWWADRPEVHEVESDLPAPEPGDWYSIDITDIYNSWQQGDYENYGLQLRPSRNDNRGSIFVSSEGMPNLRPRLILKIQ